MGLEGVDSLLDGGRRDGPHDGVGIRGGDVPTANEQDNTEVSERSEEGREGREEREEPHRVCLKLSSPAAASTRGSENSMTTAAPGMSDPVK